MVFVEGMSDGVSSLMMVFVEGLALRDGVSSLMMVFVEGMSSSASRMEDGGGLKKMFEGVWK